MFGSYDHLKLKTFTKNGKNLENLLRNRQPGSVSLLITQTLCLIFLKFKNNSFWLVKHQYWSANTWDMKTRFEKRQSYKNKWKMKIHIFHRVFFLYLLFYISGICGPILIYDHANWVIFEYLEDYAYWWKFVNFKLSQLPSKQNTFLKL